VGEEGGVGTALVGEVFVKAVRGVGSVGPAGPVAELVEGRVRGAVRNRIAAAEQLAFGAGPVVGQEQNEGVVEGPVFFERG